MLLFICQCGQWLNFVSLAQIAGDNFTVQCPGGHGPMVQVQEHDKLQIVPIPVKVEQTS